MSLEDVRTALDAIRDAASGHGQALGGSDSFPDDEKAHVLQDQLYENVLAAITEGCEAPREMAAAALEAKDIEFTRWYS